MATTKPKSHGPGFARSAGYVSTTANTDKLTLRGSDLWTVTIDEASRWTKAEQKRLQEHQQKQAKEAPKVEIHDDFVF